MKYTKYVILDAKIDLLTHTITNFLISQTRRWSR